MGADNISYIAVGPKVIKVSEEKKALAIRKVKKFIAEVRGPVTADDEENLIDEDERYLLDVDAEKLFDELVKFWNSPSARDTTYRDYGTRRIISAGELSWGDEPDGYGYQLLKRGFGTGLCGLLGIR